MASSLSHFIHDPSHPQLTHADPRSNPRTTASTESTPRSSLSSSTIVPADRPSRSVEDVLPRRHVGLQQYTCTPRSQYRSPWPHRTKAPTESQPRQTSLRDGRAATRTGLPKHRPNLDNRAKDTAATESTPRPASGQHHPTAPPPRGLPRGLFL